MCGRMTLAKGDLDEVADELDAIYTPATGAAYRPRFNIAPTDRHLIVRVGPGGPAGPGQSGRFLELASWGFKAGQRAGRSAPLLINARAESAGARGAFKAAFAERRCVVPADGFYEWAGPREDRRPFWIHRTDGRLLLLAGLYADGEDATRFCVLTTTPNETVAAIHDRMPVILAPDEADQWLGGDVDQARALLRPFAGDVRLRAVTRRMSDPRAEGPECLDDAEPTWGAQQRLW